MTGSNKPPRPRVARKVRRDGWTKDKIAVFLETLAVSANVTYAAKKAGKAKCTAYTLYQRDPAFAAAWDEAIEQSLDELFSVLLRRAKHGSLQTTKGEGGEVLRTVHSYPSQLGMTMLARYRPVLHRKVAEARKTPPSRDSEADVFRTVSRVLHGLPG